jgi:hypothetical protein
MLQLLGELADLCGPFQPTLLKLRDALLPSIYSCCSGPSLAGNRPLQFDQLPWFALAGKLRRQNNQLLEQQAAFSQELGHHQVREPVLECLKFEKTACATGCACSQHACCRKGHNRHACEQWSGLACAKPCSGKPAACMH